MDGDHGVTIQVKATEQYLPVVLFIMLYKVVLTFESVDEILWCDHSNKSYWAVLSCGTVYYAVQGVSNFWVCGWNPMVWPFKWKLLSSTFPWYCLLYYAVRGGSNFWICLKSTYNNHYSQMALFSNICTMKFGICLECCFSSLLQAELWTFFSSFRSHGW